MKKTALLALVLLGVTVLTPVSYAGIVAGPPKNPPGLATIQEAQSAKSATLDRQIEAKVANARKLAGYDDDEYVRRLDKLVGDAMKSAIKATNPKEKTRRTYVYNMLDVARVYGGARVLPKNMRKLVEEYVTWNKQNLNPEVIRAAMKNPKDAKLTNAAMQDFSTLALKSLQFVLDLYAASGKQSDIFQKALKEAVERCRTDASKYDFDMSNGKKYSDMRVGLFTIYQGKLDEELDRHINSVVSEIMQKGEHGGLKVPDALRPGR